MNESNVQQPIHIGDHNQLEIRYFASPLYKAFRQADMPWHSVDDLWILLIPDNDLIKYMKQQLRGDWREPQTIATASGIVTIGPHFMAEGLISAIEDTEEMHFEGFRKVVGAYRRNLTTALKIMTPHLDARTRLLFSLSAMDMDSQ